jgi:hypothetical protein
LPYPNRPLALPYPDGPLITVNGVAASLRNTPQTLSHLMQVSPKRSLTFFRKVRERWWISRIK